MKTLYAPQERAKQTLIAAIQHYGSALDASQTGLGKTIVACQVARELGRPVGVLCPKIVVPSWEKELRDTGVEPLFVLNYEKIRNGRTQWLSKRNKRMYTWDLPEGTLLIADEIHKAKSPRSQTAALMIAAARQGVQTLNLSATAAISAPDMRYLGYALGLHSDQMRRPNQPPTFETWLRRHGCTLDPWRNWRPGPISKMREIHEQIFGGEIPRGARLTVADLPEAFLGNQIITDPIDFGPEMRSAYWSAMDEFGVDPADYPKLTPEQLASTSMLLEMLAARQTAESLKVPYLIEHTQDLLDEGRSVAVFCCFDDTVTRVHSAFPGSVVIRGGQTGPERETAVQAFARDEARVVVVNVAAGGAGVSFHDQRGEFPRAALICPSFSLIEMVQTLGRVHRNGMKTPCLQRVLIAADTIEEAIGESLKKKANSLDALMDGC